MKKYWKRIAEHPLGALYGTLLGIVAFFAALPMVRSGMWEAALVDLAMAFLLIGVMLKSFIARCTNEARKSEKWAAWGLLIAADLLALLPNHTFAGNLSTAFAFSMVMCAFVLFFSGTYTAAVSVVPALWCCVFMPYHEEFMLLLSFPLRLSAAALSAWILKLLGIGLVSEIGVLTCNDSGNASLGKSLQMLTTMVMLYHAVPLYRSLMSLLQEILGQL